jgi:hypothetical protein
MNRFPKGFMFQLTAEEHRYHACLREPLAVPGDHQELAYRVEEIDQNRHAINRLLDPPQVDPKRRIGFQAEGR